MSEVEETSKTQLSKYICLDCGWVYDPELGDEDGGIPPGTPFEQIPDNWKCPVCNKGKGAFEKMP